jgi:hypothetical protein
MGCRNGQRAFVFGSWFTVWAVAAATFSLPMMVDGVAVAERAPVGLGSPRPVISVSPILLAAPDRGEDLQLRVSAPISGQGLPIILFAHGNGQSSDGYAPLVNYWASRGFVVIQPTFLDSRTINLSPDDPRAPQVWHFRVDDMKRVLDQLARVVAAVPGLAGRVDMTRIAAVGHSYGGITAGMLLGARVITPSGEKQDLSDPRVKVGILLSTPGTGGKDLSAFARAHFPFMNPSFAEMKLPVLVIAGDKDESPLTVRGPDWFSDAYTLSRGSKCLAVLFGGKHLLGGISGYLVTETSDESPARVAAVQELSWAYLRSAFNPRDTAWADARAKFAASANPLGRVECKQ